MLKFINMEHIGADQYLPVDHFGNFIETNTQKQQATLEMVQVTFKVKYDTVPGEVISVVGES